MIFESFFRSKKFYMLWLLPFIVIAIIAYRLYVTSAHPVAALEGLLPIGVIRNLSPFALVVWGGIGILLLSVLLFFVNAKHKFLPQVSALPSLLYGLMTVVWVADYGLNYLLIAAFSLVVAFGGLQAAIGNSKSNAGIFDFGFFMLLSVWIYPKLVLLVLWAIVVLFFSGRSTVKDLIALLLGMGAVLLLGMFYYFWTDRLSEIIPVFRESLMAGKFSWPLAPIGMVRLGILGLILLIALIRIIGYYPVATVNQRRGVVSVLSLLCFLIFTLLFIPGINYDFFYVLAFPLAYIYAVYFMILRIRWLGDLLFILLLIDCFI